MKLSNNIKDMILPHLNSAFRFAGTLYGRLAANRLDRRCLPDHESRKAEPFSFLSDHCSSAFQPNEKTAAALHAASFACIAEFAEKTGENFLFRRDFGHIDSFCAMDD